MNILNDFIIGCSQEARCLTLLSLAILFILTEIFFIALLVKKLFYEYKKRFTECRLSVRVDKELEGKRIRLFWKRILVPLSQLYLPSKPSALVLLFISVVMFFVARMKIPNALMGVIGSEEISFLQGNHYQNLIAISAGIGTVIFALIIFIAEGLRDDTERARVLLKESWLYPLSALGIITLLVFVWGNVTFGSVLVVVLFATFAIFSISRIIRILLNRSLFLKKEQELFKDRVKRSIGEALRLRVGNNIYLKNLEEDGFNIDYSIFSEDKEEYLTINLTELGIITDINFCELDFLFNRLEEFANNNDLSFKLKEASRSVDQKSLEVDTDFSETETKKKSPSKGYLLKKLGDELNGERQEVLIIPKKIIDSEKTENEITKLAKAVFEVTSKPSESLNEQLRDELNRKKDSAIESLRTGKTGKLQEVADLYISVAESFLEIIKEIGGGYSQAEARKERGAIIGGWDEVRWISRDLYSLLNEAVKTENKEAISILSYIPIAISIKAIKSSDHFVFQEFVRFQVTLYVLSTEVKDQKIKDFLLDRSWRYLKEMADFYIESELDKPKRTPEELKRYIDFGVDIMQIFQGLLKESFSRDDTQSFDLFIKAVSKLFDRFKPSETYPSAEDYEGFLKRENIGSTEKEEIKNKQARQQVLEDLEKSITKRKSEMLFGISAWVLAKLIQKDFDSDLLKKFWEIVSRYLPTKMGDLIQVYQNTHGFDVEGFWGWDWWEMEGTPEGVVGSIDVSGKFDWLFCVRALIFIKDLSKEQVDSITIAPKRDFVYLFEKEESPVKSKLNQMVSDKDKWLSIVPQEVFQKVNDLKSLLDRIVHEQEQKEEDQLINSSLDSNEVDEFYRNFKVAFFKTAGLRAIFKIEKNFTTLKRQTKTDIKQWGFNQIDDKAVFVKDWYVNYSDWGKHYGEELASAEDYKSFKEIKETIPAFKTKAEDPIEKIIQALEFLKDKGYTPSVILTTVYPNEFYRSKSTDAKFIPHYQIEKPKFKALPGCIGVFRYKKREIPVIDVRLRGTQDEKDSICVLDLDKCAGFVQHPPFSENSEKQYVREIFIFRIVDLNIDDKLRQKIIDKNPNWLQEHSDPNRYLRQKVIVNILEKFEIRIRNKDAGIKIELDNS
mgnify:CR=1 FL=1